MSMGTTKMCLRTTRHQTRLRWTKGQPVKKEASSTVVLLAITTMCTFTVGDFLGTGILDNLVYNFHPLPKGIL